MKSFLSVLLLMSSFWLNAQTSHAISGYVSDSKSGERLIGTTIINPESGVGTTSNNYGFFSLTQPDGPLELNFSFVGYKTTRTRLELNADTFLTILLEKGISLEEIQVTARRLNQKNPELSKLSQPEITMQMIESAPVILGERDVLKTIQFLPGIKQGGENTASFNVRGGSADQNLILLDGVPVYNINHLLGFFSVFNSDAIKNVNLIKGGIPARYGGRISSVLDISMKEGNMKKRSGVFSISPVSGRFTWEAPIKKDTAAYIVSLRRTFLDLPVRAFQKLSGQNGTFGYYFYDFNAKANWIINPENRVYLSLYTGKDSQFSNTHEGNNKSKYDYNWGNITSVLRWNKVFSPKMFSNFSVYYSRFQHEQFSQSRDQNLNVLFKTNSEMQDISFKTDFDYYIHPKYTLRFGGKLSHLVFNPNITQVKTTESDVRFNTDNHFTANEFNVYVENALDFDLLKINLGGRLSGYSTQNKSYYDLQPRVSAAMQIHPLLTLNASFTEMSQYLHLLTNSSLGMPTDLWVASTENIAPQKARQATFGISSQSGNGLSFGLEGYYKWMDDVVRFDEGVAFLNSKESNWEDNVLVGEGKAYGVEFLTQKETGRFTGMFSYTLSWSERKYSELNHGKWFPFKYDRRHDVSVLAEYKFDRKYKTTRSISIGFTLQSGNNLSIPDIQTQGVLLPGRDYATYNKSWETIRYTYDNPNNFKMPAFHHLDIGYNIVKQKTDNKSITWSFSVYNIYNRMNPWYYYKSGDQVKQVSLFPVIPSVSFTYRW
jgi:hypothetical protein